MLNPRHLLLVAIGGLLGSVLRYLANVYIQARAGSNPFPWGTFTVNIIGSFIIGLIFGFSLRSNNFENNWRLFLTTGFCGGFTTFSAFSNDSYLLLKQQQYAILLLYISASIIVSIAATAGGYWLSR